MERDHPGLFRETCARTKGSRSARTRYEQTAGARVRRNARCAALASGAAAADREPLARDGQRRLWIMVDIVSMQALRALIPSTIPRGDEINLDSTVVGFGLSITIAVARAVAAPAWSWRKTGLATTLVIMAALLLGWFYAVVGATRSDLATGSVRRSQNASPIASGPGVALRTLHRRANPTPQASTSARDLNSASLHKIAAFLRGSGKGRRVE